MGRYFDALDTCDALGWELRLNIDKLQSRSVAAFESFFDECLPLRKRLHTEVPDFLRNGSRRSVALGGAVLLAYLRGDEYHLWMMKRSESGVAVYSNLLHVIPSYMMQPKTRYFVQEEFSVLYNSVREYGEEIFKLSEPTPSGHPDRIYNPETHWPNFYLRELLNSGEAQLYLSGMTIDALNLRPEVCMVLLIRTPAWYPTITPHIDFNPEWIGDDDLDTPDKVIRPFILRASDEEMVRERPEIEPANMVPPGAAAFWLGVDLLRKVL